MANGRTRESRNNESRSDETIVRSSGNVFADLGLRDAGEKQTKVRLAVAIQQIIQARRLSQAAAARLLGISQPKISALANYHTEGFSVERLLHFLNALDRDVEIVIRKKPRSRKTARILVTESHLSAM
jgi:predicted XRE-type DNA-binding protein